jgi:hypothetical protein
MEWAAPWIVQECKAHNINILVAPYEADAQLAYLARNGFVHVRVLSIHLRVKHPFICH